VDQTAVEQTGERVHVRRGHVVHPRQVQSRRAGKDVAGLRDGGPRRARRSSGLIRCVQSRLAIQGRAGIRSGTRPVRDDTARCCQNTREIHGWLFRTLSARKLQSFVCLAHRYKNITEILCYIAGCHYANRPICVCLEFFMLGVHR